MQNTICLMICVKEFGLIGNQSECKYPSHNDCDIATEDTILGCSFHK